MRKPQKKDRSARSTSSLMSPSSASSAKAVLAPAPMLRRIAKRQGRGSGRLLGPWTSETRVKKHMSHIIIYNYIYICNDM